MATRKSFLDQQPVIVQLFLLVGITIACAFIFTILGMVVVGPLFGINGADILMKEMSTDPESMADDFNKINAVKVIQLVSSIGLFLVPALVFAYTKRPGGDFLQTRRPVNGFWLLMAIVLPLAASPFVSFLYELNQHLNLPQGLVEAEDQAKSMTKLFLKMPTATDLLFNIFLIAMLPAVAEEFFFRGVIQKLFYEGSRNLHAAVWLAAILFSAIHFQFMGFLPRMFLGLLLGYLFAYSGSIWTSVIAHVFNNGSQVVAAYLYQRGLIGYNIEDEEAAPYYLIIASGLVTLALFYFMQKRRYVQPLVTVNEPSREEADRDDLPFV
jgi:uncharacterized protein